MIEMTTWSSNDCGGYKISIKIANQDGSECRTTTKADLSAGERLTWSEGGNTLHSNCNNFMVTENSTVYIQTPSSDDFCPEWVYITYLDGRNTRYYRTATKIDHWYDQATNYKRHKIS